ncbi:MAG: GNAT family N-acetyltransferase [candidate division KSB1 bacterium]|nr:GNAT family N-acetyltransferase [candidate division KSB1 bacterium]
MHIRKAEAKDITTILRFIRNLAEYENLAHQVEATEARLLRFGFGDLPYFHALLAEREGQAIGMAFYFFTFSTFLGRPTLYVEDLFVLPEYRRSGVGRALMAALATIARAHDCGRMEWAVLDWNEPAQRFFRSIGAQAHPEWRLHRLEEEQIRLLAEENNSIEQKV